MFTGLIEELGIVKNIKLSNEGMEITIQCNKIPVNVKIGSSISINGACQSVTKFDKNSFTVQASNETLKITNFKNLKLNDYVNLERPLTLSQRLDGHIVSGHIDCIAKFIKTQNDGFSKHFFFQLPQNFTKYVIYKGSIAVNGISLTVASIENNIFSVVLIPSTLKEVNLPFLKQGDFVNIETDLFAKYVEKIVKSNKDTNINYEFLTENGFL